MCIWNKLEREVDVIKNTLCKKFEELTNMRKKLKMHKEKKDSRINEVTFQEKKRNPLHLALLVTWRQWQAWWR